MKTSIVLHSMSKKELAEKYKYSDKTFARRLKDNNLYFPNRILSARQVQQIVEKLGLWELPYEEP